MNIVKSILLVIVRQWAASLLTIVVAHHWVTPDQQNQVTIWFNGWSDVAVTTLLAAALPIVFGIYVKLKERIKLKIALLLHPATGSESQVSAIVAKASFLSIVTSNVSKALSSARVKPPGV